MVRKSPLPPAVFSLALAAACAAAGDRETGEVVQVVDGDTLKVALAGETVTVRLLGVDTPEMGRDRQPVEDFAREATGFTRGLALGKTVRLERDPEGDTRDGFGRALRYVLLPDGANLNVEIVARGYGHAYTRFPFSRVDEFRRLEREARERGLGLWARDGRPRIEAAQAAGHLGRVAEVCGTVASARYLAKAKGRPTFLNLDRPHPDESLTIVIWGTVREAFDAPERRLPGHRICVTGKVEAFDGRPQVVADDPSQIALEY